MPLGLLRFAVSRAYPEPRMFRRHDALRPTYDVGDHRGRRPRPGRSVLSRPRPRDHQRGGSGAGYIGGGNTGRNTAIIRSNYLTPEGVAFYDESVKLWQDLSVDFDLNLFYSTRGHFTLAHTDAAVRTMRSGRSEQAFGVASELVGPEDIRRACPEMDLTCGGHTPVIGRAPPQAGGDRAP